MTAVARTPQFERCPKNLLDDNGVGVREMVYLKAVFLINNNALIIALSYSCSVLGHYVRDLRRHVTMLPFPSCKQCIEKGRLTIVGKGSTHPATARIHGDIKAKRSLPANSYASDDEDYCFVCGKLRWMYFRLTLHEDGIEHPFHAQLCDRCGQKPIKKIQPTIMRKYKKDPHRFLANFPCNDCGVNCLAIGDWYLASHKIWEEELGLGFGDNLCITCLEKRLGRRLRRGWYDVTPASTQYRRQPPPSERLRKIWRPRHGTQWRRKTSTTARRPNSRAKSPAQIR